MGSEHAKRVSVIKKKSVVIYYISIMLRKQPKTKPSTFEFWRAKVYFLMEDLLMRKAISFVKTVEDFSWNFTERVLLLQVKRRLFMEDSSLLKETELIG